MARSTKQAEQTRRDFLRAAACAALTTQSLISTVWDMRLISAAVAAGQTKAFTDYKALVCLFLYGGNDANNMIIPTGAIDYANYQTARGVIAIPSASILPITVANSDGRTWGFHPNCAPLQTLFNQGKLAMVNNVGTLVGPLTLAQYNNGSAAKPPQLFSHNDQQVEWMTSIPDLPTQTGWGGRCADLLMSAAYGANPGTQVSMNITLGGTNTFETGSTVNQYSVSSNGVVPNFSGGSGSDSAARLGVLRALFTDSLGHSNLLDREFGVISKRADDNAQTMGKVFNDTYNPFPAATFPFPNTSLGNQLRGIARIIKARISPGGAQPLPEFAGFDRQIFFASVGGYDTHGDQLTSQANLFNELAGGVQAFYNAMVALGVGDKVTLFTSSDFGRTFATNGVGSDHAWGSHQFVVGDAVTPGAGGGGNFYGTMPAIALGNSQDVGQGRWIPTTAVDQYAATLAKWFGVADGDMNTIFPNLPRFFPRYLDFLQAT